MDIERRQEYIPRPSPDGTDQELVDAVNIWVEGEPEEAMSRGTEELYLQQVILFFGNWLNDPEGMLDILRDTNIQRIAYGWAAALRQLAKRDRQNELELQRLRSEK